MPANNNCNSTCSCDFYKILLSVVSRISVLNISSADFLMTLDQMRVVKFKWSERLREKVNKGEGIEVD